ncbi:hypothetical protein ACOSQ4_022497 [Xanthoceras sorbifolium]
MGGCATKPKVLKSDEAEVPVPAPASKETVEPAKEVVLFEEAEKKKEGDGDGVGVDGAGTVREIVVEDDTAAAAGGGDDDLESKPRSLSNLFKSEEEKDSTAFEEATSEPVKEETKVTEKLKEEPEVKQLEAIKHETTIEQQPSSPAFVDAPEKAVTEKLKEEPEAKQLEAIKHETTIEQQPSSPAFVDAPEKAITEKAPEAIPATTEIEIKEPIEKKIEVAK